MASRFQDLGASLRSIPYRPADFFAAQPIALPRRLDSHLSRPRLLAGKPECVTDMASGLYPGGSNRVKVDLAFGRFYPIAIDAQMSEVFRHASPSEKFLRFSRGDCIRLVRANQGHRHNAIYNDTDFPSR
jgi:hypothetical protein